MLYYNNAVDETFFLNVFSSSLIEYGCSSICGVSHAQTSVAQPVVGQRGLGSAFGVSATQIRNLRLWNSADKLRLVLDLSGPVQYKTFSLSAPERLIIDLSGAQLSGNFNQLALANTPIRSIRSGHFNQGDTRIVLDLAEPLRLDSFCCRPRTARVTAWCST